MFRMPLYDQKVGIILHFHSLYDTVRRVSADRKTGSRSQYRLEVETLDRKLRLPGRDPGQKQIL